MEDLISRQAAIDAFMTSTSDGDKADWCKWVLEQLPSAFVKDTNVPCKDTISRQAAIDAFEGELYSLSLFEKIQNLPSAQPEIIHCRNCEYQDKGENECESWNLCKYRSWQYTEIDDDHFCGYAKRRTDEGSD